MADFNSKESWIRTGLDALSEEGPAGLRIDRLCGRLGVTTGSFYHHFKNIEDFKTKLLEHWEEEATNEIIDQAAKHSGSDTRDQLLEIRNLTAGIPKDPEVAIRAWALRDPLARAYQERIDRRRIESLEKLYSHYHPKGEARVRARFIYCIFIGARQIIPPLKKKELDELYDTIVKGKDW
jgi:AcrR family transcriptional regulator